MKRIVKVQIPLATNDPNPRALMYDESREIYRHCAITPELAAAMDGEPKRFFFAEFNGDEYSLTGYAPLQRW